MGRARELIQERTADERLQQEKFAILIKREDVIVVQTKANIEGNIKQGNHLAQRCPSSPVHLTSSIRILPPIGYVLIIRRCSGLCPGYNPAD